MAPKLTIEINEKYDAERFHTFLCKYGKYDLQSRILSKYKGIFDSVLSLNETESQKVVNEKVKELYKEYDSRLKHARINFQQAVDRIFETCINTLIDAMDYDKSKVKENYRGILTLLPFSPFDLDECTFSTSILTNNIKEYPERSVCTAIHEISHFFFQNWLIENGYEFLADYGNWLNYVAKESITPVLLRNGELKKHFGNVKGNNNVEQLRIKGFDGSFVDWCETIYKKHNGKFNEFAKEVVEVILRIKEELLERNDHWSNAFKLGISEEIKNKELELFSSPLKIK